MKTFISNLTVNPDNVVLDYAIPLAEGDKLSYRLPWLLGLDSNQQPTGYKCPSISTGLGLSLHPP